MTPCPPPHGPHPPTPGPQLTRRPQMVVAKRQGGDSRGTMQILADVARRDGLLGLWSRRVIVPKCLYATLNRGLMYMVLSALSAFATRRFGTLSMGGNMLLGYLADLAVKPLVHPIETVVIRLNRSETGETVGELVPRMVRTEGLGCFFRGISSHLGYSWRAGLTEGIFEQLRRAVAALLGGQRVDGELGGGVAFVIGWLARALATFLINPFFRVRNMATKSPKGFFAVAADVHKTGGVGGFFAGVVPEMVRGATLQACLNLVKEHFTAANRSALLMLGA